MFGSFAILRVRRRARLIAATVATALTLASMPALAEPSASDKETARALMKDGEAKKAKGDLKGALESFRGAHAIMNVPTTGLSLGRVQTALGLLVEARDTLLGVTRIPVAPNETQQFTDARAEAQALADELEPKIPSLKVMVKGVPSGTGVKVTIDGVEIVSAAVGLPRKLNPGSHDVVVRAGTAEKKETVELAEGESKDVTLDFAVATPEPSDPKKPDDPPPSDTPPAAATRTNTLVYVGFGVGGGFLLLGGITGLMAMSKASSAKSGCDGARCPPSTHDDIDSSKSLGTISTISFVLAGAGAVVGVIGLLSPTTIEPAAPNAMKASPLSLVIGPGSVGLSGSF